MKVKTCMLCNVISCICEVIYGHLFMLVDYYIMIVAKFYTIDIKHAYVSNLNSMYVDI